MTAEDILRAFSYSPNNSHNIFFPLDIFATAIAADIRIVLAVPPHSFVADTFVSIEICLSTAPCTHSFGALNHQPPADIPTYERIGTVAVAEWLQHEFARRKSSKRKSLNELRQYSSSWTRVLASASVYKPDSVF